MLSQEDSAPPQSKVLSDKMTLEAHHSSDALEPVKSLMVH